jgi:hypothetical protein
VAIEPRGGWLPGETYDVVIDGDVTDAAGNPVHRTLARVRAPTELGQGSAAISYAWAELDRDNAIGGSYAVERRPSASASFAFHGPSVTWITAKGPGMGEAAVSIDGRHVGTVDLRSKGSSFGVTERFDGLGWGRHVITITVLGRGRGEAPVIVDGFRSASGLSATPTLRETWATRDVDGERAAASAISGASAEVTFVGTGLVWHTVAGPEHGRAAIWVDGDYLRTEDTGGDVHVGISSAVRDLAFGEHTVRIVVLGSSAASEGDTAAVAVDGFSVLG